MKTQEPCPCASCPREPTCDWGCDRFCAWGKELTEAEIADALMECVVRRGKASVKRSHSPVGA